MTDGWDQDHRWNDPEFTWPLIFSNNPEVDAHVKGVISRAMDKIDDPDIDEEDRQKIRDILLQGLARQEELGRQLARRLTEIEAEEAERNKE